MRRLRPEDQDILVEFPRVERVVQRVHRVRPPQGFALSQARHQARKVQMLHTMLKVSKRTGEMLEGLCYLITQMFIIDYYYFSCLEFPGLHVFTVGRPTSELLRLSQRYTQPETAHSAPTSLTHTGIPPHHQVHTRMEEKQT